jgi:hypothetical protein
MINSLAAAAQAMINKNADYRARGRATGPPARPSTPTVRPEPVEGLSNSVWLMDWLDPVPPGKRWRSGSPPANGGGPRGKSREGPAFRAALHRPGATRHPWRDAPFCGHPDRAPAPVTPPHGPTDGLEFCG